VEMVRDPRRLTAVRRTRFSRSLSALLPDRLIAPARIYVLSDHSPICHHIGPKPGAAAVSP
jgi:hypothetical protein